MIESDDGDYVEWKYVQELVDEVARLRKLLWDLSHPPKYIPHESQIKKFREVTGCSMGEAYSILSTTFGDMELAAELFRKRGF